MKTLTLHACFLGIAVLGFTSIAQADNDHDRCTLRTLRGTYVFAATGHNIVAGIPQPKAVIEIIEFDGNGSLTVPNGTRSVNGMVAHPLVSGGNYTVDASCAGTIAFDAPGLTFDLFFSPRADQIWMIQSAQNTVLQGVATLLTHELPGDRGQR